MQLVSTPPACLLLHSQAGQPLLCLVGCLGACLPARVSPPTSALPSTPLASLCAPLISTPLCAGDDFHRHRQRLHEHAQAAPPDGHPAGARPAVQTLIPTPCLHALLPALPTTCIHPPLSASLVCSPPCPSPCRCGCKSLRGPRLRWRASGRSAPPACPPSRTRASASTASPCSAWR